MVQSATICGDVLDFEIGNDACDARGAKRAVAKGKGRAKALLLSQPKERLVLQGKALTPSLHREGLQAQHWLSVAPYPTQCQSSPPTPENPE